MQVQHRAIRDDPPAHDVRPLRLLKTPSNGDLLAGTAATKVFIAFQRHMLVNRHSMRPAGSTVGVRSPATLEIL